MPSLKMLLEFALYLLVGGLLSHSYPNTWPVAGRFNNQEALHDRPCSRIHLEMADVQLSWPCSHHKAQLKKLIGEPTECVHLHSKLLQHATQGWGAVKSDE